MKMYTLILLDLYMVAENLTMSVNTKLGEFNLPCSTHSLRYFVIYGQIHTNIDSKYVQYFEWTANSKDMTSINANNMCMYAIAARTMP